MSTKNFENDPEKVKVKVMQLNLQCKNIIQKIWDCNKSIVDLNDLNKLYRHTTKDLQKAINTVDNLSNEVDKESERSELKLFVHSQLQQYGHIQSLVRKANVSSKHAIDKREKDLLLGTREARAEKIRQRKVNKSLIDSTSEATNQLVEANRKMEETVRQSTDALENLEKGSNLIKDTNKELKGQGSHINTTHRLLSKLSRREVTDKILFWAAVLLFFGVVLYILKKRLIG